MPADEDFDVFLQHYPAGRRQRGFLVSQLFLAALQKVGLKVLIDAVDQHKTSEQWRNPAMIPLMQTWFEQERWIQVLPVDTKAAEEKRRALLVSVPSVPGFECDECRDTGWADTERDGKSYVIPCSCRPRNTNYQRMTASSRKGQNEEVRK